MRRFTAQFDDHHVHIYQKCLCTFYTHIQVCTYIMFYFYYYVDSDYKIRTKDLMFILIVIFKEILNKMQYY